MAGCRHPQHQRQARQHLSDMGGLSEDDFARRYNQIAEPAPEGNPAQLIRETLALEREIVTGLESC